VWAHDLVWVRAFTTVRYTLPQLPWTLALACVGAHEAVALVQKARTDRAWRARGLALVAAAAIVLPLVALPSRFERLAGLFAWNCQNIEEQQVRVGVWLREHTHEGEWVATHDAGAIRIFSDRPVLDLAGLNEHRVRSMGYALLDEVRPRYIAVFVHWFPHLTASPRYRGVFSALPSRYTICNCFVPELRVLEVLSPRTLEESRSDLESSAP
jgi:hypothetical protein